MYYCIRVARNRFAYIESWDEVVVKATPSFLWAIGKPLGKVLDWCEDRDMYWYLTETASPGLRDGPPSDSEIAKRTAP